MTDRQAHPRILLFLFFLSGASGLIYEVLWMRSFMSAFGVTVYATSVVLAAFMGGLALGSYLFGRWAEVKGSPIHTYAYLEIGIGVYALLIPFVLKHLPSLYQLIYRHLSDNVTLTLMVRFGASFIVLLLPTTMMGATLPVLSKFFAADKTRVGKESGRLYAINTFGAVMGTLAAGFFLIPYLGVSRTNYLAASLNLLIGIVVLAFAKRFAAPATPLSAKRHHLAPEFRGKRKQTAAMTNPGLACPRRVLPLIGLSGFAALSYEVIWTKILSLITFNTVFAFTSMLATFLMGIALGGTIYVKAMDKRQNPWAWFAALQFGIGAYALLSPTLFAELAKYYYRYQTAAALSDISWGMFVSKQFLLASLIMFIPTVLMGASFPLACRIYALGTDKTAAGVGDVYASNTLGAIAGSTLTGLLLIPGFGLKGGLAIAATMNLLAAFVGLSLSPSRGVARWYRAAGLATVVVVLYLPFMNVDVAFTEVAREGREIIFHQEDATGVVEVFQQKGQRFLVTNRLHTEGSNLTEALYLQRKQGYLPLLLHSDPESVIEIGLGTGIGFTPVALYDKVKEAEVVEISPGVVEAAAFFAEESQNVLENPKVKLRIDDGRNYLLLTPKRYDLIILGLFTPYRSGVGYLYTRELYLQAQEKLKGGGMVVQWVALSQLPPENLRIVVNTFRSVFPYVYLWEKGYYLALVGLNEPLKIDVARFQATMKSPSITRDLEQWELNNAYNFLASFLMGPAEAEEFSRGAPLNTEDRLRIEFSEVNVPKAAFSLGYAVENLLALLRHTTRPFAVLENVTEADRQTLDRYVDARRNALIALIYEGGGLYQKAYVSLRQAERLNPRDDITKFALRKYRDAIKKSQPDPPFPFSPAASSPR